MDHVPCFPSILLLVDVLIKCNSVIAYNVPFTSKASWFGVYVHPNAFMFIPVLPLQQAMALTSPLKDSSWRKTNYTEGSQCLKDDSTAQPPLTGKGKAA